MENKKKLLIIVLFVVILTSCKKEIADIQNDKNEIKTQSYKEIQLIEKKSNYSNDLINELDLSFKDFKFSIRYIKEKAYLKYYIGKKVIKDWFPIEINFFYDNDYETVEKDIRVLYNNSLKNGFILLPSFTEELPSYFLYEFNDNNFKIIDDYALSEERINEIINNEKYDLIKKGNFEVSKNNKEIKLFFINDRDTIIYNKRQYKAKALQLTETNKDIDLILNKKTNTSYNWIGNYECSLEIVKGTEEVFVVKIEIQLLNQKDVIIKKIINNNESDNAKLFIENENENTIILKSIEDKNTEYIITKNDSKYVLSGYTIYMLNPPNSEYPLKKNTE